MSKKLEEINKTLSQTQESVLSRIESYRLQVKNIRERELNKSLIPVHEHRPGNIVGSGIEDVPHGKINPKGLDKNVQMEGNSASAGGLAMNETKKAEVCKKCGHMHMPLEKCGQQKTAKTELSGLAVSAKVPNEVNPGSKAPEVKAKGSGGVVLPGAKLKKALTASMGSGAPSTKVNDLGKADLTPNKSKLPSQSQVKPGKPGGAPFFGAKMGEKSKKPVSISVQPDVERKSEPPMAKPPSGVNMGTKVPTSTSSGMKKGDFGMDDSGKPLTAPQGESKPSAAPKPKFGLADLAAGKAKLQAQGVKPISPLASPKAAGVTPKASPGIFGKLPKKQ
jgi:hypothetical protein